MSPARTGREPSPLCLGSVPPLRELPQAHREPLRVPGPLRAGPTRLEASSGGGSGIFRRHFPSYLCDQTLSAVCVCVSGFGVSHSGCAGWKILPASPGLLPSWKVGHSGLTGSPAGSVLFREQGHCGASVWERKWNWGATSHLSFCLRQHVWGVCVSTCTGRLRCL